MVETTLVIGIDCATVDAKIGLALAEYRPGRVVIQKATLCAREQPAAETVAGWLRDRSVPALLAIDAPLGWPAPLADTLADHKAGGRLSASANEMFRRATDCFIHENLAKRPLDVGADRIARTAHAALELLDDIRDRVGRPIPLAWSPNFPDVRAIEVYPAATLVAHGLPSRGYKKPAQIDKRRQLLASLRSVMEVDVDSELLQGNADALDAVVCVLAAKDFLEDQAMCPANRALAEREGWIWAASWQEGVMPTIAARRRRRQRTARSTRSG